MRRMSCNVCCLSAKAGRWFLAQLSVSVRGCHWVDERQAGRHVGLGETRARIFSAQRGWQSGNKSKASRNVSNGLADLAAATATGAAVAAAAMHSIDENHRLKLTRRRNRIASSELALWSRIAR